MKMFLALIMLAFAGAASADTLTLPAWNGFGSLHQYHGVTTDAVPDDPVTLYVSTQLRASFASEVTNVIGGDNWFWAGSYAGSGNPSTLAQYFCSGPLYNAGGYYTQVCTATGKSMIVTLYEDHGTRCGGSGRGGGYCRPWWKLLSGQIIR